VLLLRRARELNRHLAAAIEGDERGVHQARVASRRLREAVPVVTAPTRSRRKTERKVQRLTRTLGAAREMDVALGVLDEVAQRPGIPRDALEDVRAHVMAERDRRRARMRDRLGRVNAARLSRRLEELGAAPPDPDVHDWRDVLSTRIIRRAKILGAAVEAAGRIYAPEQLHEVRIAVKKLRYALELAAAARLVAARPLLVTLKRIQETLGRLNDLQVIQRHVATVQAAPPQREGAHDRGLDVIAGVLEEECRHLHARYSKHLPALTDVVTRCRKGLTEQPAAVVRRKPAPIKMLPARAAAARRAG
jgi:CHAD domain-containing protein